MPAENEEELEVNLEEEETPENEDRGDEIEEEIGEQGEDETPSEELDPEALSDIANGGQVPVSRFKEVNDERKQLRDELDRLRAEFDAFKSGAGSKEKPAEEETPETEAFDFEAKEQEYMDAVFYGDQEKATLLRKQIRQAEQNAAEQAAREAALREYQTARSQELAQEAANAVVEQHPELNENQELLQEVMEWRDFYIAKGQRADNAIYSAAKRVMGEPKEASEEASEDTSKEDRAAEARVRGAKAAKQQPPTMPPTKGNRSAVKKPLEDLSEEEYEKMSAEERRRARGDFDV